MMVWVLIPVYNEATTLLDTFNKFNEALLKFTANNFTLIFINDCSTDSSANILKELEANHLNVKVITHTHNKGKGAALISGIKQTENGYILFGDADLELDPHQSEKLLTPLFLNHADLVNGSRFLNKSTTNFRVFVNKAYSLIFSILTFKRITDFACGFKAIKTACAKQLILTEQRFGIEAELMMKACRKKFKIIEVPVTYIPRSKAEGKKIKNSDAINILIALFKHRFSKH